MSSPIVRRTQITLGLVAAGALCGGAAGVLTLALALFIARGPGVVIEAIPFYWVAACIGGALGAVMLPLTGWLVLRHVSFGRAFAGLIAGTVGGALLGWLAARPAREGIVGALIGGVAGYAIAAAVLRRAARAVHAVASPQGDVGVPPALHAGES